jgi:hypothetical protein
MHCRPSCVGLTFGGRGGIRTHEGLAPPHGFQPCALGHYATLPRKAAVALPTVKSTRNLPFGASARAGFRGWEAVTSLCKMLVLSRRAAGDSRSCRWDALDAVGWYRRRYHARLVNGLSRTGQWRWVE